MASRTSQNSLLVHPFAGAPATVYMGRKRGRSSSQAQQAFMQDLNTEEEQHEFELFSCRHGSDKYWFKASCSNKLHVHLRAVDSVNDPKLTALRCRICSRYVRKKPSQHGRRLYQLLGRMGLAFATEVKLLTGWLDEPSHGFKLSAHPADVLLVEPQLLIEVDGSQHFSEAYQNKAWEEQARKDAMVDAACLELGFRCLRLHYQDTESTWEEAIKTCIKLCESSSAGFVHYTSKYNKAPLQ